MGRLLYLLFVILPWLLPACGMGQGGQQNIFQHLGVREGLLSDEVNATVQDNDGYIWMAGKEGLQRYDGYRFVDFRHRSDDAKSIPDNNILQLSVDKNNRLWLLTANCQLGYFDTRRFAYHAVQVSQQGKILDKVSGELYLDPQKNILLLIKGTEGMNNGVAGYDAARDLFLDDDKRFEQPAGWQILSFSFDSTKSHNLWICSSEGLIKYDTRSGLRSYRGYNEEAEPVIAALRQYKMVQYALLDTQGNFWVTSSDDEGKNTHLLKCSAADNKVTDFYAVIDSALHHGFYKIRSIVQPDSGAVWITGRSIFIKAGPGLEFIPNSLPGEFSIHYEAIKGVNTDREKNAWVSTNRGLYYTNVKPSPFVYVPNSTDVTDFIQLPDRHIVVATWGNGLFEYDSLLNPRQSVMLGQSARQNEKLVWAIHRRSNGDTWRTQQDGWLYIYHAATQKTEKIHPAIFQNQTIRQIAEDRNGNLWLSTQANLLIRWSKNDNRFQIMLTTEKPVFRLYADRQGDIWAIAGDALKINIDNGSVTAKYSTGPTDGKHMLTGDLTDIIQYDNDTYIVGGRGINILNAANGQISYFTSADGLPSDYVSNVVLDSNGELWIATEKGLCNLSFKKAALHIYNFEDGIYNSAFTPVSSHLMADGRIALGTNQDWMIFDPAAVHAGEQFPESNIMITGISIMNKQLSADSLLGLPHVQLDYNANAISIQFSSLIYSSRYAITYMMEGLDKQPISPGTRAEAVYSYLPPGKYLFKVGIRDPDGNISHYSSFNILVRAPFWKDWPFYAVLVLLAGLILWWTDKQRIQRVRQVLNMRNSIGHDLQTEVSTTLEKISILSELAAIKSGSDPVLSQEYIHDINLKSRATIVAIEDVMWSIDPSNDAMAKLTDRMRELADAVQHEYGTPINFEIKTGLHDYRLSMKDRLELILIFKKSIWLMAEQLRATSIEVVLQKSDKDLVMAICQPGPVASIHDQKYADTIADIKNRAAAINGEFEISESDAWLAIKATLSR